MNLLHLIEDDIRNVAGGVEHHVHDILAKHLTLANVAAHIAHEANLLEADPLIQAAEAAILPPGVRTALAEVLSSLDGELAKLTAPAPVAAPVAAPAEPVAAPLDAVPADAQAS